MSESKPFEPTRSRLERARHEGDVARANELGTVASLTGSTAALAFVAPFAAGAARRALEGAARGETGVAAYVALAACCAVPMLAGAAASTLTAAISAGGFVLRFPEANLSRLAPVPGLKRLVSRESILAAARAAVAATVAGISLGPVLRETFGSVVDGAAPGALAAIALHAIGRCIAGTLAVGAAFAVIDAIVERAKRRRRLRMTFDEMKRDLKQNEGDPLLRSRRRSQHRALLRGSFASLDGAAFVVANPDHVAIALSYRPPEIAVPRVLIRALDEAARLVKARARALGIPVVENVSLARLLFASTDVGAYIPRDCYVVVAQIVASLIRDGHLT